MEEFKEQVKKGFIACRSDIGLLKHENDELRNTIESLNKENSNLKSKIDDLLNSQTEMKAQIKGFEIALNYIKDFTFANQNSNINNNQNQDQIRINPEPKKIAIKQKSVEPKDPYEALLAFKAKANKRDILKQKMTSMISENGMNLSELKFMFVDHFKYCSKATFYNYLKELEIEKMIKIERENSKNFVHLYHSKLENQY